jgi:hypothetical protein
MCLYIHSEGLGDRRLAGGLIGFQSARQQLGKQQPYIYIQVYIGRASASIPYPHDVDRLTITLPADEGGRERKAA